MLRTDLRKDNLISSDLPIPQSQSTGNKRPKNHRGNRNRPSINGNTGLQTGHITERNPIESENAVAANNAKFGSIPISQSMGRALKDIGYEKPSPVQEQCIPPLLDGQDVVGQALTGTGKTAAFGIPIIERLDPDHQDVQSLILVPTRELAMQVHRELERIAQFQHINITACYGGQPIIRQISLLQRGAQIVVGTPGRILDHLNRGTLYLTKLRTLVLDEADEMLDIGFLPDIERILSYSPRSRQTSLFSATIPSQIRRIAHRHMRSPVWIRVGGEIETAPNVRQIYYEVLERDRVRALVQLLEAQINDGKALLFRRTQIGVERLVYSLQQQNIPVVGIHGGMTQSQRNAGMHAFQTGTQRLLVATNVAARGLDIPKVTHVINYDMPQNLEEYIHRIGRTARMGRDGTAITFVSEWDFPMLDTLMKSLEGVLNQETLAFY